MLRSPDAVQRGAKRNGAPLIRGLPKRGAGQVRARDGPGSAAHRTTARCARETRIDAALRPGNADTALRCARDTNNVTFPGCGAARSGAPLIRGLPKRGAGQVRARDGPGSAAHRTTARCARETRIDAALRPGNADTALRCARDTNNVTFPGCGAARSGAPLIRGLPKRGAGQVRARDGPGSAAHRTTARCARETRIDAALRPGNADTELRCARETRIDAALRPGNADTALRCARDTNNVTFPGCGAARSGAPLIRGLPK